MSRLATALTPTQVKAKILRPFILEHICPYGPFILVLPEDP